MKTVPRSLFQMRVVMAPLGATLEFTNSDPITHNIHAFSIDWNGSKEP